MADSAHIPQTLNSGFFTASLADRDPEIAAAIGKEATRQQHQIELIASENIVSRAVLEAQGSHPHEQVCRRLSGQALLWRL